MKETPENDNLLSSQGYRAVTDVIGAAIGLGRKLDWNVAVSCSDVPGGGFGVFNPTPRNFLVPPKSCQT